MAVPTTTCWTLIRGASGGSLADREEFARRYAPVARAYLGGRWQGTPLQAQLEDALQEVFLECFREEGALLGAEQGRSAGFRGFFFGVLRNVARRAEERRSRRREYQPPSEYEFEKADQNEESFSRIFDRAWALAVLGEARELQVARAEAEGREAMRGVDLLRLHTGQGVSIRELAERWGVPRTNLQRRLEKARRDFAQAIREVLASHHPDDPGAVEREWSSLRETLP
jgi:RNA polymerase sigma-70 factor (ECF subfamily)